MQSRQFDVQQAFFAGFKIKSREQPVQIEGFANEHLLQFATPELQHAEESELRNKVPEQPVHIVGDETEHLLQLLKGKEQQARLSTLKIKALEHPVHVEVVAELQLLQFETRLLQHETELKLK